MGLLDRWFGKKQEVSIEEKLRGEMQRLVKESIMYGLPGTPAPGTLDFPSFEDGFWTPAGYYRNRSSRGDNPQAYINEDDLKRSRERSRLLAACNEYARNALAVRQAYIVGTGIKTTVMPVKGAEEDQAALKLAQDVQQYLERWSALVKLPKLQKETVLRCDRDGETFLRSYRRDALELRFIEPEHVGDYDGQTPFGIVTDEDDITEVLAYLVRAGDGEQFKKVKAEEVTHIKCNTDSGIKRGLPFLFPIFTILERIEKVDENMAAVIAIQAAIAMIRRNPAQKSTAVSSAVSSNADFSRTNPYGGGTDYYKKYRAGTILDVDGNTEYEFPAIGANIGGIAEAKSSLLRTAAAGVSMAEYMITSDASNGNFASSQVAESPCISIFLATQHDFCEVFGNGAYVEGAENGIQWDAIEYAVEQGQLDPAALEMVVLKSVGPNIVVRDRTQETTRLSMLAEKGIISRDQWAKAEGEEKAAKSDEEVQAEKNAEMEKQAAMAQAKSKPAGVKEQFDEDKHPRDDDGKFASKGGDGENGESKRADPPVVLSHADTMAILSKAKQGGWRNPEDRPFKGNPWNYTAPMMQMEWVQRKANMESGGGWVKPEPFAHIMMSRNSRTVNHSEGQYTGKAHLFLYDHLFGNFIRYKNPKNPNGLFGTPEEAMKVAEAMYRMQMKDGKIKPPEKGDKHYDIVTRRKEEIKGIDGALPDGSNVLPNGQLIPKGNDRCDKCGGLGNLPHFKAIDGGVCYKCDGDGYTPSKPSGVKEQFDEDKHPRDDDGKFTSKGDIENHIKAKGKKISKEDAIEKVKGKTEKPGGVDPSIHMSSASGNNEYYEMDIPLSMIARNQNGDLYDSTTKPDIATAYAGRDAKDAPPIIASVSRKGGTLFVVDGGHRVSAARMRGDKTIKAIIPIKVK